MEFQSYLVDGPVHTTGAVGATAEWIFEPVNPDRVRIVNVATGTALYPAFGGLVRQGAPTPAGVWTLEDQGSGEFFIRTLSGFKLDGDTGGRIDLSTGSEADERWILIPVRRSD